LDPTDEQVARLGSPGRRVRFGIAAVVLLLVAAIAKPWPGEGSVPPVPASPGSTPSQQLVAAATATAAPSPASSRTDWDGAVCQSPDGWRVVADDVELGRSVRAWVVADAEYSPVPPIRSTVPVTELVSPGVRHLGFCAPVDLVEHGLITWTATLWRQGLDRSDPTGWRAVARLTPSSGWFGAPADPLDRAMVGWPPGIYFLEARFQGSITEAWLGLTIRSGV